MIRLYDKFSVSDNCWEWQKRRRQGDPERGFRVPTVVGDFAEAV